MESLAELRTLIARHAARGTGAVHAELPGLSVTMKRNPTEPCERVYESALGLVAQGAKRLVVGGQLFDFEAGRYVVSSLKLPGTSHVYRASAREPFLAIGLVIRPSVVASLLLDSSEPLPSRRLSARLDSTVAPAELVDALARLLRLVDEPASRRVVAPLVERELVWRLLAGPQGGRVRQIGLQDTRLSPVGKTVRWIRTNYAKSIRTAALARMAAMSVASFHRHFRALTAMTPLQYQKQIRLQEARVRLLADASDVGAVGFSVGYDSPSQFSREYSRVYGAPPGRDATRLREARP